MLNMLLYGPNPKFNAFIKRIKDDFDLVIGLNNHMARDDLATAAHATYKNMVASNNYYKLDPKDANILALTTQVTDPERSVSANLANVKSSGGSGGGYRGIQGDKIAGVEKLRTVSKGATIQHKGNTVCWCQSHKQKDVLFDGLYVWHKPEFYDAWLDKFKSCRSKKNKTTAATTSAPPEGSKQRSLNKPTV